MLRGRDLIRLDSGYLTVVPGAFYLLWLSTDVPAILRSTDLLIGRTFSAPVARSVSNGVAMLHQVSSVNGNVPRSAITTGDFRHYSAGLQRWTMVPRRSRPGWRVGPMNEYRVDLFDNRTHELVGHCYGPTLGGTCPATGSRGVVACAGRWIAPLARGPESWQRWVQPQTHHCPLARTSEAGPTELNRHG